MQLPGGASADEVTQVEDMTVFSGESQDFSAAVVDEGAGAFRALVHVPNSEAPETYDFKLELPEGAELLPLEDGGVVVRDAGGDLIGTFSPPWAVDAAGAAVPTEYVIEGTTLVQRLQVSSSTAFPVVADPFWVPALMVMGHLTRHAIAQAAARGVSQALIREVVQNGVRTAGTKWTSVFTQGKGASRIRAIVDNRTGDIITVTRG
ncbi:hypothetical protein SAMN05428996_2992 [Quadrisphaera sp. DSM 44207]|nr:hypothetical protein SAMN05428996_2992 [Quadrisphaera sp. DSM 44207]